MKSQPDCLLHLRHGSDQDASPGRYSHSGGKDRNTQLIYGSRFTWNLSRPPPHHGPACAPPSRRHQNLVLLPSLAWLTSAVALTRATTGLGLVL